MCCGNIAVEWTHEAYREQTDVKYKLLALDVDGTLLGADHEVAGETAAAVRAAEAAGLAVCLATGRSYIETLPTWRALGLAGPYQPMILVGGALVSEADTGRTLYHKPIAPHVAVELADAMGQAGYSAMAIVDSWRHGVDYYLAEFGDVHRVQHEWFSKMNVAVRTVGRLGDVADLPAPLRVSSVVPPDKAPALAARLKERFKGLLNIHAIVAPNYNVTIVEALAAGADKLTALRYVGQAMRIGRGRIATVGDDVNDVTMVRGAGLGAAMPDSAAALAAEADYQITTSLADFIHRLIAGEIG